VAVGQTRSLAGRGFIAAVVLSLTASSGLLIALSPALYAWILGVVVCFIGPRWLLLVAAVVAGFIVPTTPLVGKLIVTDLLLLGFVTRSVVARTLASEGWRFTTLNANWWLFLFLGWAWLSLALAGSSQTAPALGRITLYALVFATISDDDRPNRSILVSLALFAAVEAILALGGVTPRLGSRLLGFYGDPGVFGFLMMSGVAAAQILNKVARWLLTPILLLAMALTQTRGIWIAGAVVIAVLAVPHIQRRSLRIVTISIIVAAVAFWVQAELAPRLSLQPESLLVRVASWESAIALIESQPFTGYGWAVGIAEIPAGSVPPYNLWLNVAASAGIVGALLMTGFLASLVRELIKAAHRLPRLYLAFLAGFLVLSLGEMTLYAGSPSSIVFFVLGGSGLAASHTTRNTMRRNDFDTKSSGLRKDPS